MSAPAHDPLPESLRRQFEDFRRELWRRKVTEAVLAGIVGLVFSYLLVFGLDRLWTTPAVVRLLILLAGTSLFAVFLPIWLHRWVWRHRRENQLARLIARKYPGLGDRLLGVVELQDQQEASDTLSPRLRSAAMAAVAAEASERKLDAALPDSRRRWWSLATVAGLALVVVALALAPRAGWSSLKRWLLPLSSTPRYTFTTLEPLPGQIPVPKGESFSIRLQLREDSEWRPPVATARYDRQDPVNAGIDEGSYTLEFPGQQQEGIVHIEVGDARHAIRVIPAVRPSIERVRAEIDFPDYLELDNRVIELASSALVAVEGSRVRVTLHATRDLEHASYGPVVDASPREAPAAEPGSADAPAPDDSPAPVDPSPVTVEPRGSIAATGFIDVGGRTLEVPVRMTDVLGLELDDYRLRLDPIPDNPPTCYLQGSQPQRVMLPEETIDFELLAEDDFGLKLAGIEWQGQFTRPTDQQPAAGELPIARGRPDLAEVSEPIPFSPDAFDIAPQKLVVRAFAEDYLPGRGRVYSQPVILHILTRDEHAQMLKSRFDRAISELEDLARRERGLFEENQRLERLDAEELREETNRKRLSRQEDAERQQTDRMEKLGKRMEELFRDSTRNGTIDKETLKRMAEAMESMKDLAQQDMPEVRQKLGDAGDPRNTDQKSEQDVDQAVEQQKEVLEKMKEAIEKANEANERFEAGTFISRLKKAASDEEGVAAALVDGYEATLGLRKRFLDPADAGRLDDVIRQQSDTAADIRWIQEDLGHFFARTDKVAYQEILEEMRESGIDLGLEDIRLRLMRNHTFMATEAAKHWAGLLREWAGKLEGAAGGGAGGGGGGGGGGGDQDFEFMLRVMKLVQQEQDLRARTRSLETLRRSIDAFKEPLDP